MGAEKVASRTAAADGESELQGFSLYAVDMQQFQYFDSGTVGCGSLFREREARWGTCVQQWKRNGLVQLFRSVRLWKEQKWLHEKGLHTVMVPLASKPTHDRAREQAKRLAQQLVATPPERYTLSSDPRKRTGRIFLDYLRNGRGNTAVGAWSPRARARFPIAAPVTWKEVESGIRADAFTLSRPRTRTR